jgi:hypothetical protein
MWPNCRTADDRLTVIAAAFDGQSRQRNLRRPAEQARGANSQMMREQALAASASWVLSVCPAICEAGVYRPQSWISPVPLVNGRMEGTWRHEIKGSRVEVVYEPFTRWREKLWAAEPLNAGRQDGRSTARSCASPAKFDTSRIRPPIATDAWSPLAN